MTFHYAHRATAPANAFRELGGRSIYTSTARFDTGRALTEDDMRQIAPSIFATEAHESRSDRFRPIPTIEVLRGLKAEGFEPVGVKQATARDPGKAPFTKHLIRLRKMDAVQAYKVGDTVAEVLLKNANDGSAAYDIMAGLFRIACMNSLVTQTQTLDSCRVKHSGDVQGKVIEGTFRVIEEAKLALAAPQDWARLTVRPEAAEAFAEAAHVLRFADADGEVTTPVQPAQLLTRRRADDRANDLWTTFNVVQENTIRGGLSAIGRDANNRRRRTTTRAVNGIDQDVRLNKALWTLGERFAQLLNSQA